MNRQNDTSDAAVSGGELRELTRIAASTNELLVLLAFLHFCVAGANLAHPGGYLAAVALYGGSVLVSRYARMPAGLPDWPILAPVATVFFVTSLLAFAGGDRGPLLNLYVLPLVTAALTLGRRDTLLVGSLVLAARVALSHFSEGADITRPGYALTVVLECLPIILIALLTPRLVERVRDAGERLQAASDRDEITGLLNLQAFTRLLLEEHARANRRGGSYALVLVDIEALKSVNERFGHEAGNKALAAVAQALKRSARSADLVARYGGDEFLVFISGAGAAIAGTVANRIRHNVATTTVDMSGSLHRVAVSIGVAVFPSDGRDLRDLVKIADRAAAKDRDSRRPLARAGTVAAGESRARSAP